MKRRFAPWLNHLLIVAALIIFSVLIGPQLSYNGYYFLSSLGVQAAIAGTLIIIWSICHLRFKPNPSAKSPQTVEETNDDNTDPRFLASTNQTLAPVKDWYRQFPETRQLPMVIFMSTELAQHQALLAEAGEPLAKYVQVLAPYAITWHLYQKAIIIEWPASTPLATWSRFLKQLRPWQKQLQGIFYCCSAVSVSNSSSALLPQLLVEFAHRIKRPIALYMIVTQLDQVPGFQAFFANNRLAKTESLKLDFSFIDHADQASLINTFEIQFQQLVNDLQQVRLSLLDKGRSIRENTALYAFPHHFAKLSEMLKQHLHHVNLQYAAGQRLGGVYFTAHSEVDTAMYPAPHFWPMILQQLANHNSHYLANKCQRQTHYTGLAVAGTCLLLNLLWLNSFYRQQQDMQTFKDSIRQVATVDSNQLLRWYNSVAQQSIWPTVGLTVHSRLLDIFSRYYGQVVSQELAPALQAWFQQNLPNSTGMVLYRNLKAYLMLGDLQHRDPRQLNAWLEENQASLGQQMGADKMQPLSAFFQDKQTIPLDMQLVKEARLRLQQLPLAELAYSILQDKAGQEDNHSISLTEDQGVLLQPLFADTVQQLRIPKIYTKSWLLTHYTTAAKRAEAEAQQTDWVLGEAVAANPPGDVSLHESVTRLYLNDYLTAWQQRLQTLSIKPFQSLNQAAIAVNLLTQANSPFDLLLNALYKNTDLNLQTGTGKRYTLSQVVDRAGNSSSELHLAKAYLSGTFGLINAFTHSTANKPSAGYSAIKTDLLQLNQLLTQLSNQAVPNQAILQLVTRHYAGNANDALSQLQQHLAYVPQPLQTWLQQLLDNIWQLLLAHAREQLNTIWQQQVFTFYQSALAGRYPLDPTASKGIATTDFNRFFAPGGMYSQFYKQNLQMFVDENGDNWQWRNINGHTVGFSDDLLKQLQKIHAIQQGFFAGDTEGTEATPAPVSFEIKPIDLAETVTEIRLTINGQTLVYGHGPQQYTRFSLPNQDSDTVLTWVDLQGQEHRNTTHDAWGFFRLLQQAQISQDKDSEQVIFRQGDFYASFVIKANSALNPFSLNNLELKLSSQLN